MRTPHILAALFLAACTIPACDAALGIDPGLSWCDGLPAGTPLPEQTDGDCKVLVCDVDGRFRFDPSPEDKDDHNACTHDECKDLQTIHTNETQGFLLPNQTAGDCKRNQCDGAGHEESVNDDADFSDDENDCTIDACVDGASKNSKKPVDAPCGVGGALKCDSSGACVDCTEDAQCSEPSNPCLRAVCNAGKCATDNKTDGTACNDGAACTQTDTCQSGVCTGSDPVICAAQDQCHLVGKCDPATGACSNPSAIDGISCNDQNACTQTDTCLGGVCVGDNQVVCSALDQCHTVGICDPTTGACSNPNKSNGSSCNDQNACSQTDTCQAGVCTGMNNIVCSAGTSCVAGSCVWCNGKIGFPEAPLHVIGSAQASVAAGDLNGDGKPDLVFANDSNNTITVLLNLGAGKYSPATVYSANQPVSVAIADFNADGKLDVVAAELASNSLQVWQNQGDGTLVLGISYNTGNQPSWVVATDINADGNPDLVSANRGSNDVAVLLSLGNGAFAPAITYATGQSPRSVAAADLNGDNHVDLVTANYSSGDVSVLLNQGNGTFALPIPLWVGWQPNSVTTADVNGDGQRDIITARYLASQGVGVLLNQGNGKFASVATYWSTVFSPPTVVATDLNGDGMADIAVASSSGSSDVSVLMNQGTGTFAFPVRYMAGGGGTRGVVPVDLNGDGNTDLAVANGGQYLRTLINAGNGTFLPSTAPHYPTGNWPSSVAAADLNGDNKPDLAVTTASNTLSVFVNQGSGSFALPVNYTTPQQPVAVVAVDLNGDWKMDLAVAGSDGMASSVSVFMNPDNAGFAAAVNYASGGSSAYSMAGADFNGDGKADLAVGVGNWVNGVLKGAAGILLNQGNAFAPVKLYDGVQTPRAIAAGNLNGDNSADLVTGSADGNAVSVLLNQGMGTFVAPISYSHGATAQAVTLADLNGDGFRDILVDGSAALMNKGNGSFALPITYGASGTTAAVIDLNGDGQPDLARASYNNDTLIISFNAGNGTFSTPTGYAVGNRAASSSTSMAAADFDGDGRPDLAVLDSTGVNILRNTCLP